MNVQRLVLNFFQNRSGRWSEANGDLSTRAYGPPSRRTEREIYSFKICLSLIILFASAINSMEKETPDPKEMGKQLSDTLIRADLSTALDLINKGADLNTLYGPDQLAPLHRASFNGFIAIVQVLLARPDIDVNIKTGKASPTGDGIVCLMGLIQNGKIEIIELLLNDARTNVNIKDNKGYALLHYAATKDNDETMKRVLARTDIDVNIKRDDFIEKKFGNEHGATPLHYAAFFGRDKCLPLLLDHPCTELNIQDKHGYTALFRAIQNNRLTSTKLLLNYRMPGTKIQNVMDNLRTLCSDRTTYFSLLPRDLVMCEIAAYQGRYIPYEDIKAAVKDMGKESNEAKKLAEDELAKWPQPKKLSDWINCIIS